MPWGNRLSRWVRPGSAILISSGTIYSPQYGYAAFTVPLFDTSMKRIHG